MFKCLHYILTCQYFLLYSQVYFEMTSVIKTYLQYNKVRSNNENSWVHECINAIVGQKM